MTDYFEYKDYLGSAEVDIDGSVLVGKLLFIRDTITYSASTPKALEKAFREAVDEYLETCAALGDEPDKPCKGTFNVRIGPELHREVAVTARSKNLGLNEFVRQALVALVQSPARQFVEHVHHHEHIVELRTEKRMQSVATSTSTLTWKTANATQH